jgi:hypothetical protein
VRSPWLLLLLCCYLGEKATAQEANKPQIPKVWNGEALEADEGALYLQSQIVDTNARAQAGTFTFTLRGRKRQLLYIFQTETMPIDQHPHRVWKIKEDDYDIERIQSIDDDGHQREWRGPYRYSFRVQSRALSHFGAWYLVQLKQGGRLSLLIKKTRNVFDPNKSLGSFNRIIDAENGALLLELKQAAASQGSEIRQVFRTTRTIGMFYKLNLFRQNTFAPAMIRVLETHEADIRTCYTDYLERNPKVRGSLNYAFVYSGTTRSIRSLKIKNSDLQDGRFLECMMYKVMGLSFPVDKSLIGELSFTFHLSP